jgi:3-dehydroquinate synthase
MEIISKSGTYKVIFTDAKEIKDNGNSFFIVDNFFKGSEILDAIDSKRTIFIEADEKHKEYISCSLVIEDLIKRGFKKNNILVAVGGGVIQDITSFIASILFRGVEWEFLPTTLLAQGDSCIGSKTSINFGNYKNQIGGFYPPRKITICLDFLETLPEEQILSGIGEMSHYFLLDSADSFMYFKEFDFNSDLQPLIEKSLSIKKKMVEIDEFDTGPRVVFNYGHSFGHAIECAKNYSIPHGIAVAKGMDIANFISLQLGFINEKDFESMRASIGFISEKADLSGITPKDISEALKKDKKNRGNKLGLILTKGVGNMYLEYMDSHTVLKYLELYFVSQENVDMSKV